MWKKSPRCESIKLNKFSQLWGCKKVRGEEEEEEMASEEGAKPSAMVRSKLLFSRLQSRLLPFFFNRNRSRAVRLKPGLGADKKEIR